VFEYQTRARLIIGEQRGIFPPDEDDFSRAYCMYVKKNQQSMAEKDPLWGVLAIFKQIPVYKPGGILSSAGALPPFYLRCCYCSIFLNFCQNS